MKSEYNYCLFDTQKKNEKNNEETRGVLKFFAKIILLVV